jgi:hypothetical protein
MTVKTKRFILGVLLSVLALCAASAIPTLSSHGVNVSAPAVAYADGCDGPHPPPDPDCLGDPTPTPTPPGQ